MAKRTRYSMILAALTMFVVITLVGCSSAPTTPPAKGIDLEGLWLVTPGPFTSYGAGGTSTLEFGAGSSGSATYLSKASANDITTCRSDIYAVLTANVVLLVDDYYEATLVTANRIDLKNGTDEMTLERVTGVPPVAPCAVATATQIASYPMGAGSFTTLNSFGPRLYFNIDDSPGSIVAFDTVAETFSAPRAYSKSVLGGIHHSVIGVRSDELFYGQCGCGGSTSVNAFNLATDTSITSVDTRTFPAAAVSLRYGYFAGANVLLGGRDNQESDRNLLLTLNPDTLALLSQRQILDEARIQDITVLNGNLLALVGKSIVVLGAGGRANQTVSLPQTIGDSVRGLAVIDTTVYLLTEDASDHALLFEVALP